MPETGPGKDRAHAELEAEVRYTRDRVALYRRRMTLGRGDPARMRALEREAESAAARLAAARDRAP